MLLRIKIFLLLFLLCNNVAFAQGVPNKDGQRLRYNVQIDIRKAYISGICAMLHEDGQIKATIVNEFGVTAISFLYNPIDDKVKIVSLMDKLNHWYIRRILRRDLLGLIHNLENDQLTYQDLKYKITYTFSPVKNDELTE